MAPKDNKRKFKPGQLVLADSHANVQVKVKLTKRDSQDLGWFGVLVDKEDAKALKEAGVPWIEPEKDETFTFDYQILKLVYRSRKKREVRETNGKRTIRKRRSKRPER